jgi:hypothetical protein
MRSWGLSNVHLESWGPYPRGWTSERFAFRAVAPRPFMINAVPAVWSVGTEGRITGPAIRFDVHSFAGDRLIFAVLKRMANAHANDFTASILCRTELLCKSALDAKEREELCDQLYHETASHFRQIRVVEIQKQEQRARAEGRQFRTDELAADLWDGLTDAERQPLVEWLDAQTESGKIHSIPEGQVSLPDANDMLDANTAFFRQPTDGKAVVRSLSFTSRSHAEMVFTLAQLGLRGPVKLPEEEAAALKLNEQLAVPLF